MATLKDPTRSTILLRARHWVGRSVRADLRLSEPVASEEHAVIAWTHDGWVVRDLGSLNGTFASGIRIAPGVGVPLRVGDALAFGAAGPTYTLMDDRPPAARACTPLGDVQGDCNGVRIPLGTDRVAVVTRDAGEGWVLRHPDGVVNVRDGQSVLLDGQDVVLMLPEVLRPTQPVQVHGVPGLGLVFRVSADEEYVEITVEYLGRSVVLPPRAHHYPLMVLARARVADAGTPDAEREAGWVYNAELQRMLQLNASYINLVVHRARRELAALGVQDAGGLIERRLTTRQMRLGVANVRVERL